MITSPFELITRGFQSKQNSQVNNPHLKVVANICTVKVVDKPNMCTVNLWNYKH